MFTFYFRQYTRVIFRIAKLTCFFVHLILLILSRALLGHSKYDRVQSALDLTAHGDRDSESDLISIEICCCIFLTSIQT